MCVVVLGSVLGCGWWVGAVHLVKREQRGRAQPSHSTTAQGSKGRSTSCMSALRRADSLTALADAEAAAPRVQLAEIVGFGDRSRFRVPVGASNNIIVPPTSPELARAYLQARTRGVPAHPWVDLTVVLDGTNVLCYGPPTAWEFGVAARVQRGQLRIGILRIFQPGSVIDAASLTKAAAHGRPSNTESGAPAPALVEEDEVLPRPRQTGSVGAAERDPRSLKPLPMQRGRSGSLAKILARSLKVGRSNDPGGCSHMEDADLVHAPPGSDFAFIGVFDGHGGEKAAQFCREHLHLNVMASSSFRSGDPRAALRDGFRKTEADLIFEQRNRSKSGVDEGAPAGCCGSTVLLMLLQLESMHVAWLGDCRAVLCRSGEAIAITQDHCLKDEAERERALADGGTVVSNRLGGFLEVARALGDFDHTLGRKPAGLSAQPELRTQPLQPNDEFVILGSDGLWGVVNPDDAVRIARAELQAYDGDAQMASEKLLEVAQKRHADDNITALVAVLNFMPSERETPRERPRLRLMPRRPTGQSLEERMSNSSTCSGCSNVTAASSSVFGDSVGPNGGERMSDTSERMSDI